MPSRHKEDGVAIFSSWVSANIQVTLWQFQTRGRGKYRFRISGYGFQTDKPVTFHVMAGPMNAAAQQYLIGYYSMPIQLKTGRLVVPVWLSTGTGGNAHRPSVTATIISDDRGKTWQAGEIAVPCTDSWINPNETVAIELSDGRVMLNVRNESKAHRRLITISVDGATNWSKPKFDEALLEPICMGGIVRYNYGGQSLILFSNPHNLETAKGKAEPGKSRDRKNVSVKISRDEGQTWPVHKTVEPGPSMYSDIAVTQSGTILCFYGRGAQPGFAGKGLTLARFNIEWLTSP